VDGLGSAEPRLNRRHRARPRARASQAQHAYKIDPEEIITAVRTRRPPMMCLDEEQASVAARSAPASLLHL
jgi:hypothetical protein